MVDPNHVGEGVPAHRVVRRREIQGRAVKPEGHVLGVQIREFQRVETAGQQGRRTDVTQRAAGLVPVLVDDRVAAVAGAIAVDVVAAAAPKQVVARAADQRVVARRLVDRRPADPAAAEQGVIAGPAGEQVAATAAVDIVVAVVAEHRIVTGAGPDGVVARPALDQVVAGTAEHGIGALIGVHDVVARARIDVVVARADGNRILTRAACDRVRARAGNHRIVAVAAVDPVVAVRRVDHIAAGTAADRVGTVARRDRVVAIARIQADCGAVPIHAVRLAGAFQVGHQIGHLDRGPVLELDLLERTQRTVHIGDAQQVAQSVDIDIAFAQADDQVIAVQRGPEIVVADAGAETQDIEAARPLYRTVFAVLVDVFLDLFVAVAAIVDVQVVAGAAAQRVGPDTARQGIVAVLALEQVVPQSTQKDIVAFPPREKVVSFGPEERIVDSAPHKRVSGIGPDYVDHGQVSPP